MIRTIKKIIHTLLFQAHFPPTFWVESLHIATHLLNITPSSFINNAIPFTKLCQKALQFSHLRVFGYLCYPHIPTPHKLAPRSTPCSFLGYTSNHHGFRCFDLSTRKILTSHHVVFKDTVFPFKAFSPNHSSSHSFLDTSTSDISPMFRDMFLSNTSQPNTTTPLGSATTEAPPTIPSDPILDTTPSLLGSPASENATPTPSHHPMVTYSHVGISKTIQRLNLHTTTKSPLPKSHLQTLQDPNWSIAMQDALIDNNTWTLVPRPKRPILFSLCSFIGRNLRQTTLLERYKPVNNLVGQSRANDFKNGQFSNRQPQE